MNINKAWLKYKGLLKERNFLIIFLGDFISGIGTRLCLLALAQKIYILMPGAWGISFALIMQAIPFLFLGFLAGKVVDRFGSKESLIIANIFLGFISLSFIFISNIYTIYLISFLCGIAYTLEKPARNSILPLVVDKEKLLEANSLRSSLNSLIMLIGYALGGIIVALAGVKVAFLIDAITFYIIAASLLLVHVKKEITNREHIDNSQNKAANQLQLMMKDFYWILGKPILSKIILVDLLTGFIIAMQSPLVYAFVAKYLGGETSLAFRSGLLFAACGIGGIIGGFLVGVMGQKLKNYKALSIVLIADGISLLLFDLSSYYFLSLGLFCLLGVIFPIFDSVANTSIQETVDSNNLGRIYGLLGTISVPFSIVSLAVGGFLEKLIGVKIVFAFCAGSEILVGLLFLGVFKKQNNFKKTQ